MECKFAYEKKNCDYVLCSKEKEPNIANAKEVFHSACSHQEMCQTSKCHKLSRNWVNCVKLKPEPIKKPAVSNKNDTQKESLTSDSVITQPKQKSSKNTQKDAHKE